MNTDTRITRDLVVTNNLVDRYLLGQMDEREAMAFEDFYAGDPETLAELEVSAQLIDSMQAAGRRGELKDSTPAPSNVVPLTSKLRRVVSTPAYGMAASFIALVAVGAIALGNLQGVGNTGSGVVAAVGNVPIIMLGATRGAEDGRLIEADRAGQTVFSLDLGYGDADSYSAALQSADGDLLLEFDGLTAVDGMVNVLVPDTTLPNGRYVFTVRPESAGSDALRFPFEMAGKN